MSETKKCLRCVVASDFESMKHTCGKANETAPDHQRLQAEAAAREADCAAMRRALEQRVGVVEPSMGPRWLECGLCGATAGLDEARDLTEQTAKLAHEPKCPLSSSAGAALLAERDELREAKAQAEAEVDAAIEFVGVIRDELVKAGGKPGDRDVALDNLRALIAEMDALEAALTCVNSEHGTHRCVRCDSEVTP